MRILLVHNYYQQAGGERKVFEDETCLLQRFGHEVFRYTDHNDRVEDIKNPLLLAGKTIWNNDSYRKLRSLIQQRTPEVMHVHNTLPLISPAAYYAAAREGVPVVQTLHNYRLMCPLSLFHRNGQVCEDCLGKSFAWPAVLHGCYRDNRAASGAVATMVKVHETVGTWTDVVDQYIALTQFARGKFIEGGLPAGMITVKPNFVFPDPGFREETQDYAVFVGRLTREKGVPTLLEAWEDLSSELDLKIAGDGPLARTVEESAERQSHVEYLGYQPYEEVLSLMGHARIVIVPSEWYETFGRVVTEAFAVGTPAVVANIGAIAELVEHGRTGRLFAPGDAADLARQVRWLTEHTAQAARMSREARAEYEDQYTGERNHEMLLDVYNQAV